MARLHPGKTLLKQYMQPNQLSQNKLARSLGVPPRRINEIILGKRAITADSAIRLAAHFGNSAIYWMHLQAEYDIISARDKLGQRLHMIQSLHITEVISKQAKAVSSKEHTTAIESNSIKRRLMR